MRSVALIIANALIVGGWAYYAGASLALIVSAIAAIGVGGTAGLLGANWLEENGYTIEAMLDDS